VTRTPASSQENQSKEEPSHPAAFVLKRLLPLRMGPWIRRAARLGHFGIGSVYIVVGAVAFNSTLDAGVRVVGFQGALRRVLESYAGPAALVAIGLGLVADGVWQGVRSALNADMAAPGLRGLLERASWLVSGLIHLGLGLVALKLPVATDPRPNESQLRRWAQLLIATQFGDWVAALVGFVVILVGMMFIYRAAKGDMDPWLDLSPLNLPIRIIVMALGRFGVAARGSVFVVGGTLLVLAAVHVNPREAHGVGGTLRIIESQQYGHLLLASVALGFIAYGIFELARARYRHIPIPPYDG
jgi:hypothetical protein